MFDQLRQVIRHKLPFALRGQGDALGREVSTLVIHVRRRSDFPRGQRNPQKDQRRGRRALNVDAVGNAVLRSRTRYSVDGEHSEARLPRVTVVERSRSHVVNT